MHPEKKRIADKVLESMKYACRHFEGNSQSENLIESVLGLPTVIAEELIHKIIIALPSRYFYLLDPSRKNELIIFIAKSFFLFQINEDIKAPGYTDSLINFIASLSKEIEDNKYK